MRTKPTMHKRMLRSALVAAFSAVVAFGALSGLAGTKGDARADSTWRNVSAVSAHDSTWLVAAAAPGDSTWVSPASAVGTDDSTWSTDDSTWAVES